MVNQIRQANHQHSVNRLFIKVAGNTTREIYQFIYSLQKIYPATSLTISPIIKNKDGIGFHCFINVLLEPNKAEDIISKLEPPEEPPMDKEV